MLFAAAACESIQENAQPAELRYNCGCNREWWVSLNFLERDTLCAIPRLLRDERVEVQTDPLRHREEAPLETGPIA
jgi:hypothetical protein